MVGVTAQVESFWCMPCTDLAEQATEACTSQYCVKQQQPLALPAASSAAAPAEFCQTLETPGAAAPPLVIVPGMPCCISGTQYSEGTKQTLVVDHKYPNNKWLLPLI